MLVCMKIEIIIIGFTQVIKIKNLHSFILANFSISILVIFLLVIVIGTIRTFLYFSLSLKSSKNLHTNMFNSVSSTAIRFFDLNPLGRIINRFSKDVGLIDEKLPTVVLELMNVNIKFNFEIQLFFSLMVIFICRSLYNA